MENLLKNKNPKKRGESLEAPIKTNQFSSPAEYKKYVAERLFESTPILQKVAMGDFSENVVVPEKEDEFTELLASLNLMIDDLKELTEVQKRAKEEIEQRVKERTRELRERTEDLEDSKKALVNILEDVTTARQNAEEEKRKTISIITNLNDGLLFFDKEEKLSLVNPQAEKFFDVRSLDMIGKTILELKTFPAFKSLVGLVGEGIKGIFRKEIKIGKELVLEVSSVPVRKDDENLGNLVILHDVSREKMIEIMKTEFVSLAAHQLRTPLSAIKWTLKMILDGDLGSITKEQGEFIGKTYDSNERMISLINDLLDITRIEEGRYLFKPILTDFEPIVQFAINSCQEEIKRRGIKFQFKKPEKKLPQVRVDVEKIKLAIQNIIENAIKYTPLGGEVRVLLKYNKKEIEFQARDSGVGIPEDQQDRVFSKFFRASNVLRMETEGSGLGLFITKNIIEAHGGKIWFKSPAFVEKTSAGGEKGSGTTFYFSLPTREKFTEFLKEF
jgi:PAS domain S-box-containing protein